MKRSPLRLSEGEMEILMMLWDEGPLGLADAVRRFGRYGRAVSYPTMQTRLNRLVAKKLAARSDRRPAIYEAAITRQDVTAGQLDQVLKTTRRSSVVPLVAHLLSERPLTPAEVRDLRKLLSESAKTSRDEEPEGG